MSSHWPSHPNQILEALESYLESKSGHLVGEGFNTASWYEECEQFGFAPSLKLIRMAEVAFTTLCPGHDDAKLYARMHDRAQKFCENEMDELTKQITQLCLESNRIQDEDEARVRHDSDNWEDQAAPSTRLEILELYIQMLEAEQDELLGALQHE
jgi:hypothetical protein